MSVLYEYPPKPASWNERDILLFANSIGCEPSELHYLYELHPNFSTFPTYPISLTFKHDYTTTTSFHHHFTKHLTPPKGLLPGFPALNISKVLDGERTLDIYRPLPTTSLNRTFTIHSRVLGIWDKGPSKPTIVQTEHLLLETPKSATGIGGRREEALFSRMSETAIFMEQGGWGGPNPPSPHRAAFLPTRSPDATHRHEIPRNAHLLYRLNGDYNPLHATEVGEAVVRNTPIMHGLYGWNVVAGVVVRRFAGSDGKVLKRFRARFVAPVRPGDVLETRMWRDEGRDGELDVRFETRVQGRVVLADGVAVLRVGKNRRGELNSVHELVPRL